METAESGFQTIDGGRPPHITELIFYEWLLVFFSWTASWWITIHGVLPPRRHQYHLHRLHDLDKTVQLQLSTKKNV